MNLRCYQQGQEDGSAKKGAWQQDWDSLPTELGSIRSLDGRREPNCFLTSTQVLACVHKEQHTK